MSRNQSYRRRQAALSGLLTARRPSKQAEQQAVNEAEARLKQGDAENEAGTASKNEVEGRSRPIGNFIHS